MIAGLVQGAVERLECARGMLRQHSARFCADCFAPATAASRRMLTSAA
jgi:hypothetical protein